MLFVQIPPAISRAVNPALRKKAIFNPELESLVWEWLWLTMSIAARRRKKRRAGERKSTTDHRLRIERVARLDSVALKPALVDFERVYEVEAY